MRMAAGLATRRPVGPRRAFPASSVSRLPGRFRYDGRSPSDSQPISTAATSLRGDVVPVRAGPGGPAQGTGEAPTEPPFEMTLADLLAQLRSDPSPWRVARGDGICHQPGSIDAAPVVMHRAWLRRRLTAKAPRRLLGASGCPRLRATPPTVSRADRPCGAWRVWWRDAPGAPSRTRPRADVPTRPGSRCRSARRGW